MPKIKSIYVATVSHCDGTPVFHAIALTRAKTEAIVTDWAMRGYNADLIAEHPSTPYEATRKVLAEEEGYTVDIHPSELISSLFGQQIP